MRNIRIIPQLNIKGPNVVKPIHTEALRIVGNPVELASRYYDEGADEIIYLDIVASLYQRNLDFDLLKSVAQELFIPLTVGGGIRTSNDVRNALRAGADKIAINTYALHHPEFLKEAVEEFGSQCIVLYVEAKKTADEEWEAYTDGGREKTGVSVVEWVKRAIGLGVGEILLTSIDRDGTRKGYDMQLIKAITSFSPIPVIAHGGGGELASFREVVMDGEVDAISASSVFHYEDYTIAQLKRYLVENSINVRI